MLKPATPTIMNSKQVQDAAFDLDRGQQRPLLFFPGRDPHVRRVGTASAVRPSRTTLSRVVVLQLDLERGAPALHPADGLELFERHEDEALVVLAHLGLEVVGDQERTPDRLAVRRRRRW